MSHYRSNVRDLEFNLFEVLGAGERMGVGPFAEMDAETARGVLHELEKVASGPVAASFVDADRNPPVYDPATFSVTMPESFKKSYRAMRGRRVVPAGAARPSSAATARRRACAGPPRS